MATYQVSTLNSKADRLLKDLADLNIISIHATEDNADDNGFMQVVEKLRQQAEQQGVPTLKEITAAVEAIRTEP